jgi:hypothetical protein
LCRIGPNNRREHVLAKLRNSEPTMPQWKVTLATTKKPRKDSIFKQGKIVTLAAASVIKWVNFVHKLCFARPKGPCPTDISVANQYFFSQNR